jgi:hypothetical protein
VAVARLLQLGGWAGEPRPRDARRDPDSAGVMIGA